MDKAVSESKNFNSFAKNVFSQCGEDGIIEKILDCIPNRNNWCVEFGAWDGIHLSNTYNLIKNKGYQSVLIEANKNKFKVLKKNFETLNAVLVNEFVSFEGKNTLDNILSKTKIPANLDFLSIDIDGNDYYILESLVRYQPKVICIEYNPTIPNEVIYIQPKDFGIHRGSSAQAILNLARSKGYALAAATMCNLILVDAIYLPFLNLQDAALSEFRDDESARVFAFVGYDGSVCLSKPLELPWHNIKINEDGLQALPTLIRRFRGNYNFAQKIFYVLFTIRIRVADFLQRLKK